MKKIILLLSVFMAFAFSFTAKAQCIAATEFPEDATTSNNHGLQEIAPCNFAGDFSTLIGLTIGQNYEFTSSVATDYLTLTDVSNNVIASGLTPLIVNAISIENVRLHIHLNASCEILDSFCRSTTIQCTSCAPPAPANNDCSGAITLTPGATFSENPVVGSNVSATGSGELPLPGCADYTPGGPFGGDVWYSVTVPVDGNLTIEINGNATGASGDSGMAVYSGACGALALVECDDDGSPDGAFSRVVIEPGDNLAGQTVYVRVWEFAGNAAMTFQVSAHIATLSSSDLEGVSNFTYYPNPVKNTLQLNAQSNIQNISVYNMLGQEVLKTAPNDVENNIDMSELQTGAYFVKVTINDKTETIRIIKN